MGRQGVRTLKFTLAASIFVVCSPEVTKVLSNRNYKVLRAQVPSWNFGSLALTCPKIYGFPGLRYESDDGRICRSTMEGFHMLEARVCQTRLLQRNCASQCFHNATVSRTSALILPRDFDIRASLNPGAHVPHRAISFLRVKGGDIPRTSMDLGNSRAPLRH